MRVLSPGGQVGPRIVTPVMLGNRGITGNPETIGQNEMRTFSPRLFGTIVSLILNVAIE